MDTLSEMLEDQADLHMSPGTIGKIEVGIRSVYDYEIAAFADVLGISTDWLLYPPKNQKKPSSNL